MDTKIFDRIEKKYLLTKSQEKAILKELKKHTQKDKYHKSGVFNIYFDTDNYDLIIQSIDHPVFKEKLRARSYEGYDKVFFEIKTKLLGEDDNVGYKRRVLVTHKDYDELVAGRATMLKLASRKIEQPSDLQIAKEIDYFIQHFDLKPKILVYYSRESYKNDDNGLRITFDKNLKYRHKNLKFTKKSTDKTLLKSDKNIIMEIKAHGIMPLWLVNLLSSEKIYPERFSKIGKVYEQLKKEENV